MHDHPRAQEGIPSESGRPAVTAERVPHGLDELVVCEDEQPFMLARRCGDRAGGVDPAVEDEVLPDTAGGGASVPGEHAIGASVQFELRLRWPVEVERGPG